MKVDINKIYEDKGDWSTIEKWVEYTKNSEFKIADISLDYAISVALYDNRNDANKETRELVRQIKIIRKHDMNNSGMVYDAMLTHIGNNIFDVAHNYGQPNERHVRANLTCPDGFVSKNPSAYSELIKAIFETEDIQKFVEVFSWATGKEPYVQGFNGKYMKGPEGVILTGNILFEQYAIYNTAIADTLVIGDTIRPVREGEILKGRRKNVDYDSAWGRMRKCGFVRGVVVQNIDNRS